jgi:hypothetical protein
VAKSPSAAATNPLRFPQRVADIRETALRASSFLNNRAALYPRRDVRLVRLLRLAEIQLRLRHGCGGMGIRRAGGGGQSQAGSLDYTVRQAGFEGSVSAKLTGPIPQIAMTAGSFWPRITPS